MPQVSDTKLLRQAFKDAGFRQAHTWPPMVFNDKHKSGDTRRLKLWDARHVFSAPQYAQEELERQFKLKFGNRYLFGEFRQSQPWNGNSRDMVVYLLA